MKYIPLSLLLLATVSSCDGCKNKSTSTTDEIYVSDSIKEYSPEPQIIQYSQDPENTDTPIDTTSIEFENIPTASVADSINLYIAGLAQNEKAIHVSFSDIYQNDTLDVPPHYIKNQKKLGKEFMKYFPLTGNYFYLLPFLWNSLFITSPVCRFKNSWLVVGLSSPPSLGNHLPVLM